MNIEELKEARDRYQAELLAAEREAAQALQQVESLQKVVDGLSSLMTALNPSQTQLAFSPQDRSRLVSGRDQATGAESASVEVHDRPRGREAVRLVLKESRRTWRLAELADEVERRGWMPDAQNVRDAVSATTQRLLKDGEIQRVGFGQYRYRVDKLPFDDSGGEAS